MTSPRSLILVMFICAGLFATGCEPGETTGTGLDNNGQDSGVEDVYSVEDIVGDDAESTLDANDGLDTTPPPDPDQPDITDPDPDPDPEPDPDPDPEPEPDTPTVSILSPSDGATIDPTVEFSIAAEHVAKVQIKVDDWPLSDPWNPTSSTTLTYTLQDTGSPREVILYGYDSGGSEIARDTIFVTVRPTWNCSAVACSAVDVTTTKGKMRSVDGCAFELGFQRPISEGKALADRLLDRLEAESMGTRRSLSHVMQNLNRDARSGLSTASKNRLSGLSPKGFRWNTGDDDVAYWMPQGITGSSDARANGKVNGKRWVMNAWYHKTSDRPTKGVRLALADITNPSNIKYRLLLLVDPIEVSGKPTFKEASYDSGNALHAGGIVWYGDYLFVADTAQGFRVYDLSRIFSPSVGDKNKIGIQGGESYAHNYGFAVPRIARYRWKSGSCKAKFSFLGLDRDSDPPALISGQYDSQSTNEKLVVWPLDPTTHLLEERGGTTRASQGVIIGQHRAQGSIRRNGHFYVSSSSQDGNLGRLYKGKPGQTNSSVKWLHGAEDIYLQRDANRVWTGAEHPGRRDVANIPLP